MKTIAFLLPLLFQFSAMATPLSPDEVIQKLEPLAMKDKHPTTFKASTEVSVTLPTTKPPGDEKQEWIDSYITGYIKEGKVQQVAIVTENCNIKAADINKAETQERVKNLVKMVSNQLSGIPFELDGERYFKELGADWAKGSEVKIQEQHPGVRKMRLSRDAYKCDSRGGIGFRYDFFL